jgi:hypothetical protein
MLFYESASCLHGRRQIFKGKYYASIFMHYKPADDRVWDTTKLNIEVSIYISIIMIDKIMFIMNGDRDDDDKYIVLLIIFLDACYFPHCYCAHIAHIRKSLQMFLHTGWMASLRSMVIDMLDR